MVAQKVFKYNQSVGGYYELIEISAYATINGLNIIYKYQSNLERINLQVLFFSYIVTVRKEG